jgi:manganese transport protein
MLYIAVGILGATVMPHNLYLHSSIVQTRKYVDTQRASSKAIRFRVDRLVDRADVGAVHQRRHPHRGGRVFHGTGYEEVADISDAYKLLSPLLGAGAASTLFAVALLFAGQNATLTGTLAGQIVMEGFVNIRLRPGCGG